jgi:hypothetical protein
MVCRAPSFSSARVRSPRKSQSYRGRHQAILRCDNPTVAIARNRTRGTVDRRRQRAGLANSPQPSASVKNRSKSGPSLKRFRRRLPHLRWSVDGTAAGRDR